jgi:hypothetical protein
MWVQEAGGRRAAHVVQRPLERVGAAAGDDVLEAALARPLLQQARPDQGIDWVALEAHEGQRPEQAAALGEHTHVVKHARKRRRLAGSGYWRLITGEHVGRGTA